MTEVVDQKPNESPNLMAEITKGFESLKGVVWESVKTNVLDKFKLEAVNFKPEDLENGKLRPDILAKLGEQLKAKVGGADLTPILTAAGITQSAEDLESVKGFFADQALKNLNESIEEKLKGFESFTEVKVTPTDLLQFEIEIIGVQKKPEQGDEKKDATPPEVVPPVDVSIEEEKKNLQAAIGKAGILGWLASKFLFQTRKDKDGNDLPSYIEEAYGNPDSPIAAILGMFGVPRFEESYKKATNPEGMPEQMKGFVNKLNNAVAPYRVKVQAALKGNAEEVRNFTLDGFMEQLEKEEFKNGLKEPFVLGKGGLNFTSGAHDGKKVMIDLDGEGNPPPHPNNVLTIPKGQKYSLKASPDEPFVPKVADENKDEEIREMSGGVLYIGDLPEGTKFPVGATIKFIP